MSKSIFNPGFILDGQFHSLFPSFSSDSFFDREFLFELGLIDVNSKVTEEDFLESLSLLVPSGCQYDLVSIGSGNDGSYLLPDVLSNIDACFSPGVGSVHTFEDYLAHHYSISSFMCDDSVNPSNLRLDSHYHHFIKKRLSSSTSSRSITLDNWVLGSPYASSRNLLLQMDIEGSEYPVILSSSNSVLSRFSVIVLELHYLSLLPFSRFANRMFCPFMSKILSLFDCVHFHPNNSSRTSAHSLPRLGQVVRVPNTVEVTFLRKDLNTFKVPSRLPHPLDTDNDPSLPSFKLGFPWVHSNY